MKQKNNYKFYLSYWESYKALTTDKEKTEFVEIINKVHFFEEHIERIKPKNANVKLLFASIKHSLQSSIQGFCDKKGIDYNSLFENNNLNNPKQAPSQGGIKGGGQDPSQEIIINNKQQEINNKEIEKKLFQEFIDWDFSNDENFVKWLSDKNKLLKDECKYSFNKSFVQLRKEAVIDYCESKNKTYKDYRAALRNFINSDIEKNGWLK